ncbi:MAG TPA: hypothetical protein DG753_03785 [Clostridium sp.]|nr:hypothetical protein [Clostridium sp.]
MKIKQIRNATMIISYAGKRFLIDPMLGEKGAYPPFPLTENQNLNNPTVELPVSIEEIIDVDAVILTHLHLDHFDPKAIEVIPKDMKIFAQSEVEASEIESYGFTNVEVLKEEGNSVGDIKLIKTYAKHYEEESILEVYEQLKFSPEACGVIFKHPEEKTLYLLGDTVWCDEVKTTLEKYTPDIVVINAGNAQVIGKRSLIMSKEEFFEVTKVAPNAQFLATHMEAVNHATLSRKELRKYSEEKGFSNRLAIPADGEVCEF